MYVCHHDQATGKRKTLHNSEHGVAAYTSQHNDKVGMWSEVQQEVCDDYCANPCFEVASYEGINLIDGGLIAFGYFSGQDGKVSVDIELELESESTLTGNSEKFEDNCKLENPFWPELCDL